MMNRTRIWLATVFALLVVPVAASGQGDGGGANQAPTATISPASGSSFTTQQVAVTVTWHDDVQLDPSSAAITYNGQDVTTQFSYSGTDLQASSTATIMLPATGSGVLTARICDTSALCSTTTTASYSYAPSAPPTAPYGVSVTPDAGAVRANPGTSGLSVPFTIRNTGTTSTSFDLTVTCSGQVTCSPPGAVTVAAGASATVNVGYSTSATAGKGHIHVDATRSLYTTPTDSGSVDVMVGGGSTYPVSVTPDAGLVSVTGGGSGTQAFTVTNFGNTSTTYGLTLSCSGNLTCGSGVPASVTVAAGASAAVSVPYTAGTGLGSGRILLRANPGGGAVADSGWLNVGVAVGGQANPVVEVGAVNPNGTLDRGGCFTAAGAPGVMYECGAFVTGHAMPSLRTLGKDRAPALVYNSETAHPVLLVSADVGLPTYAVKPDSVTAKLSIAGAHVLANLGLGTLAPGTTRRAAVSFDASGLATGLYADTLEVRFWYGTAMRSTAAPGVVAVVNTGGSPFGAGWSVAGLSYVVPSGSDLLWVDGDGSTTVFHSSGISGKWIGDALGQPDSLYSNGGFIERDLKGGGKILLDANWREVAAINRLGLGTSFTYDATTGRLTHIATLHGIPSGWAPATNYGYDFLYTAGFLSSVQAPGLTASTTRNVGFVVDTAKNLASITDPDGSVEQFEYGGPLSHMLSIVTDSRGSKTALGYTNPARTAWSVTRYGGGSVRNAQDVQVTYVDPRAWPLNYGLLDPAAWPGVYDGPKPATDTADVVRVWLDRLGQPTKIRDPRFNETYLTRGDPRFPALVTQADAPGAGGAPGGSVQGVGPRRVSLAYFNARGGLDSTVVKNPLGDGRDAVSRYAYENALWPDFVTRSTSPTGLVSVTAFDSAGNRVWQQAGLDGARRTFFGYNVRGQVTSVRSQRAITAGEPGETVEYEPSLGNDSAVVSPLGIRTTYQHDAIGRDTLVTTPADSARDLNAATTGALLYQTQRTTYDIAGRVLQTITTSPATRYWGGDPRVQTQTVFDVPGQTLTVTDTYDERHDLVAVTRASTPDSAKTGAITTRWKFDALGRTVAEIAPDPADSAITVAAHDAGFSRTLRDSTVYDVAGNVTRVLSRRGKWTEMRYDAMNRLTLRTTDSVSYAVAVDTVLVPGTVDQRDIWYFPLFSPGPDGTPSDTLNRQPVVVRGDTAVFAYDAVGNVLQADNADAKVHRSYYPGGLLQRDSLYIRNYSGTSFGHAYGITHTYDLEGRLVRDDRPAQLAAGDPTWAQRTYGYDPVTGALGSISQASGGIAVAPIATFSYDFDGRLTETDVGSSVETGDYDADGRSRWEKRVTGSVLTQLDSFTYDVRGKRIRVRSLADSTANAYSGMGALVWSWSKKYNQTNATEEAYAPDALANNYATTQVFHSDTSDFARYERGRPLYQRGTGRLLREDRWDSALATGAADNQTASLYDAGGNRTWYMQKRAFSYHAMIGSSWLVERNHSYYGADEKLRVMDRRTCVIGQVVSGQSWWAGTGLRTDCVPPEWTDRPTWEEYRYDALGRRVLVRTNQTGWACQSRCVNGVTRTIWDGDQILAEIRAPIAVAEQDTGRVPVGTAFDHGYGQVLYTQGPSLDHPLQVTRLSYDSVFPNPVWITPHTNWQGSYDSGEIVNSDNSGTCHRVSSGWYDNTPASWEYPPYTAGEGTGYTHPDSITVCVDVDWPAPYQWKSKNERGRGIAGPAAWMGSLIEGGRDLTGQMYMRNRFYDPQTGRFTQEDPSGIAGGLNLYGFANGDPVRYSDPYGLAAEEKCPYGPCEGDDTNPRKNEAEQDQAKHATPQEALAGATFLLAWTGLEAAEPLAQWALGALGLGGTGVWDLPPVERGLEIEEDLGGNLPANFPTIDRFSNGVATSIKSVDLNAPTYQNGARLLSTLNGYSRALAAFNGATFNNMTVLGNQISARVLNIAIPAGGMSPGQAAAMQQAAAYAAQRGVQLVTSVVR